MQRLVLKLAGMLVVAGFVWWRLEGMPLPDFLKSDDGSAPLGLALGSFGEPVDMNEIYGTEVDSPAQAATIVFSQIQQILESTEQAAETAALRQARGCTFSTLPDMSDCPDPGAARVTAPEDTSMPAVVTGRGTASAGPGGVVVVRPRQ